MKYSLLTLALLLSACGDISTNKNSHNTTTTTTTTSSKPTTSTPTSTSNIVVETPSSDVAVPTFSGNSQGKLVFKCEDDIVYYVGAYDCLKPDTKPEVTAEGGNQVVTEALVHSGEVFYTEGYVERTGKVKLRMRVFSGGKYLDKEWVGVCE